MGKKFVYGVVVFAVALIGFGFLSAATNKVSIVDRNTKINWFGAEKNASYLTNVINEEKSDLANGKVVLDVTIHNSLETEIIYAIDNGKSISTLKNDLINRIKTIATNLESIGKIKQGISVTTDGVNNFIDLDDKNITNQLESIKNITSSTTKDGEIFASISKAANGFSSDENNRKNRILVVFTSSLGSLTEEEIVSYKNAVDSLSRSTSIIVYGINEGYTLTGNTPFERIFDSAVRYGSEYTTNDLSNIDFLNNVLITLPTVKDSVSTTISFDKVITDNFDIKDITISKPTTNTYNEQERTISFNPVIIGQNEDLVISYTLQVKDNVDASIVDKTSLRTSRQIVLTGDIEAQLPANDKIDDPCSPTIMILSETSSNPYTGTYDYVIFGSCMLAVALVTLVIMNSKKSFNRI